MAAYKSTIILFLEDRAGAISGSALTSSWFLRVCVLSNQCFIFLASFLPLGGGLGFFHYLFNCEVWGVVADLD